MSDTHVRHLRSTASGTTPGTVNEGELALNLADGKLFYGPSGGGAGVEVQYIPLGGGTMTGPLTLSGDPSSNLQAATKQYVDNAISSGTRMLFHQSAAPTGWTKDTTANLNNTALRIVTGSVGSRTNRSAFSTVFSKASTDGHQLTVSQMPSHNHTTSVDGRSVGASGGGSMIWSGPSSSSNTRSWWMGHTGGNNAHSHNMDIRVNYHDVIIAVKD